MKTTKKFRPGERVLIVVRCQQMHPWAIKATAKGDGSYSCGEVSAPNAADDPTCCPECHEPFTTVYSVRRDQPVVSSRQPRQPTLLDHR